MLADGDARAARAVDDHLGFADVLFHHAQGVDQRRADDNGGAVLVVMEHGNIANFLQALFNFKAPRRGDVLQVDAAEGAGNQVHRAHDLVHVLAAHADGEGVHVAEGLEQSAFAFHHGHTGFGPDVAQAQHGGAVGDDGHQVVAAGEGERFIVVLLNFQAGLRHAGRVGNGQIVLVLDGNAGHDLDLALPFAMQTQGFFHVIQLGHLLKNLMVFGFIIHVPFGKNNAISGI